jgi:hypothetical protein
MNGNFGESDPGILRKMVGMIPFANAYARTFEKAVGKTEGDIRKFFSIQYLKERMNYTVGCVELVIPVRTPFGPSHNALAKRGAWRL